MKPKNITGYKIFISAIGGFALDVLGGWDNELAFLLSLIGVDIISGILKAIKTKTLSSTAMRGGLCKKAMIILIIALSVRADLVIQDFFGHPIKFNNYDLYLRTAFCLWFMLEELLSIIENCAELNVPLPNWLKDILLQVNNGINSTTPTQVVGLLKKIFNVKPNETNNGTGSDGGLGAGENVGNIINNIQNEIVDELLSDNEEDSGSNNTLLEDK